MWLTWNGDFFWAKIFLWLDDKKSNEMFVNHMLSNVQTICLLFFDFSFGRHISAVWFIYWQYVGWACVSWGSISFYRIFVFSFRLSEWVCLTYAWELVIRSWLVNNYSLRATNVCLCHYNGKCFAFELLPHNDIV